MAVLPKDYKVPEKPSKYMKFQEGKNAIRMMSEIIMGYEYWVDDSENKDKRKPIRVKTEKEVPEEFSKASAGNWKVRAKYFWAVVVWNYQAETIQILEITQATVQKQLTKFMSNPKWGDSAKYDILIYKTKTGVEARDVEYQIMPEPKSKMDKGIVQFYKDLDVKLEALFEGEDPFAGDSGEKQVDEAVEALKDPAAAGGR